MQTLLVWYQFNFGNLRRYTKSRSEHTLMGLLLAVAGQPRIAVYFKDFETFNSNVLSEVLYVIRYGGYLCPSKLSTAECIGIFQFVSEPVTICTTLRYRHIY